MESSKYSQIELSRIGGFKVIRTRNKQETKLMTVNTCVYEPAMGIVAFIKGDKTSDQGYYRGRPGQAVKPSMRMEDLVKPCVRTHDSEKPSICIEDSGSDSVKPSMRMDDSTKTALRNSYAPLADGLPAGSAVLNSYAWPDSYALVDSSRHPAACVPVGAVRASVGPSELSYGTMTTIMPLTTVFGLPSAVRMVRVPSTGLCRTSKPPMPAAVIPIEIGPLPKNVLAHMSATRRKSNN